MREQQTRRAGGGEKGGGEATRQLGLFGATIPALSIKGEIGQQLGVAHLLEGNVQRIGNRLRVNAQLINADTDTHVWAQTYDRDLADVFAIQSEIAKSIATQLQAKLSPQEKSAINERPTSVLAAYDLYLQAKELLYQGEVSPSRQRENLFEAVQLLDQAVDAALELDRADRRGRRAADRAQ